MKRKLLSLAIAGVCALSLAACGSSNDTKVIESGSSASSSAETSAEVSGYYLTYDGMDITVDSDASAYTDALGDPTSYFESPSCAGEGIGKLYTYNDIEIQTYPDGDKDLVLYVLLRTDNVATNEGIDLSKSMDDVKAVYGEPTTESSTSLTYEKDGMSLNFLFDGDSMISIEYDSSKN